MQFTEDELITLNTYLNGVEDLPVDVAALNVKLREHFQQDTSVETPEVEAAVADETVTDTPVESAPEETSPEVAPVDETVSETDGPMIQAQDPETSE